MYLTLEVTSANAAALGAARRKVFSVDGGRIGRAPENQMVLAGVGVHRHHATVRFINGVFFIEGVGSNGIAVNNPDVVIPRNEPYPLKSGDKVFIDEFELVVTASSSPPSEPSAPASRAEAPPAAQASRPRSAAPLLDMSGGEDLDPLKQLNLGGAAPPPAPRVPEQSWNHSSALSDHFSPSPIAPFGAPGASQAIPEDWDKTSFNKSKLQSAPPVPPPPPAAAGSRHAAPSSAPGTSAHYTGSSSSPANAGYGTPSSPGASAGHASPSSSGASRGYAAPSSSSASAGYAAPSSSPASAGYAAPSSAPARSAPGARAAAGESDAGALDWDAFLRAAGVDPATVSSDTSAVLGQIMRSVVQGLIEVLRARSEIKTEFRMPVTQVKVSENNPLKFAANAEDALANLFGRRNPAYLPPKEAFDDAFSDVRFHQLAMLVGVRAGFDHLMSRFDPEQLEEVFAKQGRRGLFGGAKPWEMYSERYREMAADRDETFRRLFGEEFARAYEQQLAVLKRGRMPRRE